MGKTRNMVMVMVMIIATAVVRGMARFMHMAMVRDVVMAMDITFGGFGCGYNYG